MAGDRGAEQGVLRLHASPQNNDTAQRRGLLFANKIINQPIFSRCTLPRKIPMMVGSSFHQKIIDFHSKNQKAHRRPTSMGSKYDPNEHSHCINANGTTNEGTIHSLILFILACS